MSDHVVIETGKTRERMAFSALLASASGLIIALVLLIWLIWMIIATPKATAFDADGVRCYRAASEMVCLKTAEPAR